MKHTLACGFVLASLILVSTASEESLIPVKTLGCTIEGERPDLGKMIATFSYSPEEKKLGRLSVEMDGKKLEVPASSITGHPELDIHSARLSTERGYGPQPWYYVTFAIPGEKIRRFYFAFQDGKFMKTFIHPKTEPQEEHSR